LSLRRCTFFGFLSPSAASLIFFSFALEEAATALASSFPAASSFLRLLSNPFSLISYSSSEESTLSWSLISILNEWFMYLNNFLLWLLKLLQTRIKSASFGFCGWNELLPFTFSYFRTPWLIYTCLLLNNFCFRFIEQYFFMDITQI